MGQDEICRPPPCSSVCLSVCLPLSLEHTVNGESLLRHRPNLRMVGNVTVIPSLGEIEGRETPGKAQTLSCLVSLPTRRSSLRRTP